MTLTGQQMIIKKDYSLDKNVIEKFNSLLGAKISYLTADKCFHNRQSDSYGFSNGVVIPFLNSNQYTGLHIKGVYNFEEHLQDEVSDLRFFFDTTPYFKNSFLFNQKLFSLYIDQGIFEIKTIKIYGEERTVKWNNLMVKNFFSYLNESEQFISVSDYLFTKEILIFESTKNNQLIFQTERGGVILKFSDIDGIWDKNSSTYFYSKSELDANYESPVEYQAQGVTEQSDIPRLKLHYSFE